MYKSVFPLFVLVLSTVAGGCTVYNCDEEETTEVREFVVYETLYDDQNFVYRNGDPAGIYMNSFAVAVMSDYDELLRVQMDCYDADNGDHLYRELTPFYDTSHDFRPAEEIDEYFHPNVYCDAYGVTEDGLVEYYATFDLRILEP